MAFPLNFWLLFAVCMILCLFGIRSHFWLSCIGQYISIAAEGLIMLLMYRQSLSPGTSLCCALLIIYSWRLGRFNAYLDRQTGGVNRDSDQYRKEVPMGKRIAIWVTRAVLHVSQIAGVFYRLHNGSGSNLWVYIGAAVMVCGIALAAFGKSTNACKRVRPRRFIPGSLTVRTLNYLGEIIFWTGVLISGIGAVAGVGQWVVVLIGYVVPLRMNLRFLLQKLKEYADEGCRRPASGRSKRI